MWAEHDKPLATESILKELEKSYHQYYFASDTEGLAVLADQTVHALDQLFPGFIDKAPKAQRLLI